MSIYIEGIDFPQDGMVRSISIEADGSVRFFGGSSVVARAVELPPHGRLGDLDELEANLEYCYRPSETAFLELINEAETIIPADPAEEGEGHV